ncbi:hypothetical protein BST65_32910 [Bradyrhizobium canariense]|nr:hypothetical protein BST65_32910 [Bradyrhizobium canariense]OSI34446.1 hypothetical protein BST66_10430 [Bradyrhizobium canariense]OSI39701.1 hypothetical protein BSZ20_29745 [Bradyrhizobium canariense]OSI47724.1 hypothetical protein BST67_20225 [Bradyrhizobium canariense]OSI56742.1 hypothetical protein BSZ15_15985 [Bradyrhizobium canariense]
MPKPLRRGDGPDIRVLMAKRREWPVKPGHDDAAFCGTLEFARGPWSQRPIVVPDRPAPSPRSRQS